MDGVNHLRSAQTTVGKRKQEDHGDLAPAKRVKPNAELSLPHLPTPNRSPSLVETATSPPTSVESSSSDGSSSCDTDVRLPPPYPNASGAFSIHPSAIDREGIHKPESVCGFGSRATSTTSSDTDSSDSDSSSELATVVSDRVILMPSSSNLPFPSSQHALTSQNLTNLQKRLSAFLPTLYTANQALEIDRAEGRLGDRNVEVVSNEEEPYIEMDLSLGVLEETHGEIRLSDESDSESTTSANARECSSALAEEGQKLHSKSSPKKEKDILGKLMGRSSGNKGSSKAKKPKIEVLS